MTKRKFIAIFMVIMLLFGVFTPAAHATQIVDVPFTSAPAPNDVFLACGIGGSAWGYWEETIAGATPDQFSNQILIDYGPNWAEHLEAQNRYCYVFSGAPNWVYANHYGYTSDDALSPDDYLTVTNYFNYINGNPTNYFDTYISSTNTFSFKAPYAIVWNDGVTANSRVEAETYTDPEGDVGHLLTFYDEGEYYWPNSEYTYEMAVSIFDNNYTDYPVLVFAQNGMAPGTYYYTIYEDEDEVQYEFEDDPDFIFGDGVGTPDVPGDDIDLSGVEDRLDEIIDNQHEQIGHQTEQIGILNKIEGLLTNIFESVKDLPATLSGIADDISNLPSVIAQAIADALENIEIGSDESGNGRNFFDMIVDVFDRFMDFLDKVFDGAIEFFTSILEYMAAIGEVVVNYLLEALKQLGNILELILMVPGWISTVLGFLPPPFANFISMCVTILFVALLIRFAVNIIK